MAHKNGSKICKVTFRVEGELKEFLEFIKKETGLNESEISRAFFGYGLFWGIHTFDEITKANDIQKAIKSMNVQGVDSASIKVNIAKILQNKINKGSVK